MSCKKCQNNLPNDAAVCTRCGYEQNKKSNNKHLIISIIVLANLMITGVAFGIGYLIATSSEDGAIDFINVVREENPYVFINQMNQLQISNNATFMTEHYIYVAYEGEIIVFDREFNQIDTYLLGGRWEVAQTLYVTNALIYYTNWNGELYQINRENGTETLITRNVHHKVVVGNMIFHTQDRWDGDLYVFDLNSNERTLLFSAEINNFIVDPLRERLLIDDQGTLLSIDFDGHNLERIAAIGFDISFDGDYFVSNSWDHFEFFNMNDATTRRVAFDGRIRNFILTDTNFVYLQDHQLYIANRDLNDARLLTDNEVSHFQVLGDYVLYVTRGSDRSLHLVDFEGNNLPLFSNTSNDIINEEENQAFNHEGWLSEGFIDAEWWDEYDYWTERLETFSVSELDFFFELLEVVENADELFELGPMGDFSTDEWYVFTNWLREGFILD